MTTNSSTSSVTITRDFDADITRVYAFWTNPEAILKWWGMPGFTNLSAAFEAQEGGQWHVESRKPDGTTVRAYGKVLKAAKDQLLVYDWRFEGQPEEVPSSTVTVRFAKGTSGTRVLLEHSGLSDQSALPMFEQGWNYTLGNFQANMMAFAA